MRYTVLGDPVLTAGSGHDGQHNQDYLDTTHMRLMMRSVIEHRRVGHIFQVNRMTIPSRAHQQDCLPFLETRMHW